MTGNGETITQEDIRLEMVYASGKFGRATTTALAGSNPFPQI